MLRNIFLFGGGPATSGGVLSPLRLAVFASLAIAFWSNPMLVAGDQPPAINPFESKHAIREDAVPGYLELSDGSVFPGHLHITRDARLKIYDEKIQRQREVPWNRIKQVQCDIERQWMEKEWRFLENANDRKVFTGRNYPARLYVHTITLSDGRKISGPLSGVVYVQQPDKPPRKFPLHKRQKGKIGDKLDSVVYVLRVRLGPDALKEGEKLALERAGEQTSPKKGERSGSKRRAGKRRESRNNRGSGNERKR